MFWPSDAVQVLAIGLGALVGWRFCAVPSADAAEALSLGIGRRTALVMLVTHGLLLTAALLPPGALPLPGWELFAAMYRAGALVFGGGHVVLPLLETETVRTG